MLLRLVFCHLLLFWLVAVSHADIKQTFVIGVEDSQYYPHFAVQNGTWTGFAAALMTAFSQSSGYHFTYRVMPIERLYRSFLSGAVDFKYPDNPDWRKDLKKNITITYSTDIVRYIDGVSVLPHRLGQGLNSISVIGTLRGFTPVSWQQEVEKGQVALLESDTFEGLVRQVLMGRIDGVYANIDVVQYKLSEIADGLHSLVFDEDLPHDDSHYRLSTVQHSQIINEFDNWLSENQALVIQLKSVYFKDAR